MDVDKEEVRIGVIVPEEDRNLDSESVKEMQIDQSLHEIPLVMDVYSNNENEEMSDDAQNQTDQNTSASVVNYSDHVSMVTGTEIPVKKLSFTLTDAPEVTSNAVFAVLGETISQKGHQQEVENKIVNQDEDGLPSQDKSGTTRVVAMATDNKTQQDIANQDTDIVDKDKEFDNLVASNNNLFIVESEGPADNLTQHGETVTIVTSNDSTFDMIGQNVDNHRERMKRTAETMDENFLQQTFASNVETAVTMTTETDSKNTWHELNQSITDQQVIEVKTEKVKPGSTPVLKIMKIVDQVQQVDQNTDVSDSGKIVLDDAVLRAILLATSNDAKKVEGHSATDKNIADTTEVISYEDGGHTVITIVHSDNEINMDASEIVTENDLSVSYVENVSEECVQEIGKSEMGHFKTIRHIGGNITSSAVMGEMTEICGEKEGNTLEMLQNSVYEMEKGNSLISDFGQNISRSRNSEGKSSKNMPKEMSSNTADSLYTVKLTLDDLCNVIKQDSESLNSEGSCIMKSTGVQTSNITESYTHCEVCNKFIRKHYFKHHYSFHTGEKKHSCDICKKAFMTSQHLRRHQVVHSKEKPFPCELCGNCYTQKAHLKIHMRTHNEERNYHCTICDRSFYQSQNLKRHMISHSTNRPYKCKSCDKTFKFKDHLIDHERLHSEKPLYECDICNMPFRTRSGLFTHKISHSPEKMAKYKQFQNRNKEKKFSCTSCGKSFMIEKSFNSHKCPEEKNYLCDICNRYFFSRVSLVRHRCRKAELEELPRSFICMACGEKYYSEHMLREHQLHAHIKNATFSCEICGFKIVQDAIFPHLESHVGQHGRYKCHCCEEEFGKTELLKKHMSLHSDSEGYQDKSLISCSVCRKSFKSKKCLANHMNRHHAEIKEFNCHVCSLNFESETDFNKHLQSHDSNSRKDYECEVCHKKFVQEACYEKHIKIHVGKDQKYKCHFCAEQFTKVEECRQHISEKRCSKAINIFKCKFCNRQYNKRLFLNEHLKGHLMSSDEFRCIDCPKHFQNGEDLTAHCLIHTDIVYECSTCQRCFNDKLSLDRHTERHTGSNEAYKCADCIEEFNNNESLREHVKYYHKINIIVQDSIVKNQNIAKPSCEVCGKHFYNERRLKRHLQCFTGKTKTYRCHKCPEEFDEMKDAKSHMDEIHGNENIKKQMTGLNESDFSDTEISEGETEDLSSNWGIQNIEDISNNPDILEDGTGSDDILKNKDTPEQGNVDIPKNKDTLEHGSVDIPKNKDTPEQGNVNIPKNKDTLEHGRVDIPKNKDTSEQGSVMKAKGDNSSVKSRRKEITKNKNNKTKLRSNGNNRKRKVDNAEKERNETVQERKCKVTFSQNSKKLKNQTVKNNNKTMNKGKRELKLGKTLKRKHNSIQDEKPKKTKHVNNEKMFQNDFEKPVVEKRKTQVEQGDMGTRRSQRKSQRPSYLSNYVDQKK